MLSNFPFDFFLIHELFRNVLLNFQIFGDFSRYFIPLVFNSVVVREHTLYNLNYFKFIEINVMA